MRLSSHLLSKTPAPHASSTAYNHHHRSSSVLPAYAQTIHRALYLRLHPSPPNLQASRQILAALRRYGGEIVMYQHLKHDPVLRARNSALAIFRDRESAERILSASPLVVEVDGDSADYSGAQEIENEDEDEDTLMDESQASDEEGDLLGEEDEVVEDEHSESKGDDEVEESYEWGRPLSIIQPEPSLHVAREFPSTAPKPPSMSIRITAAPSGLDFSATIRRQFYCGNFELDRKHVSFSDLERRVPLVGMADCRPEKREVPWRARKARTERDRAARRGEYREQLG